MVGRRSPARSVRLWCVSSNSCVLRTSDSSAFDASLTNDVQAAVPADSAISADTILAVDDFGSTMWSVCDPLWASVQLGGIRILLPFPQSVLPNTLRSGAMQDSERRMVSRALCARAVAG